jgi:hypothetical protein
MKSVNATASARPIGWWLTWCLATAALITALLTASAPRVLSQGVELVAVNVATVGKGYRVSKLTGSTVVNDKNERIGTIDDLVIDQDRVLFAIIQVGGFLGLGGRLVAVPYSSLKLEDDGRKITLPGASKDALTKLPEFKYLT